MLRLLARGRSNPEIAELLIITRYTVKSHIEHILRKLGVNDRTEAAVEAMRLGLIGPTGDRTNSNGPH